MKTNLTIVKNEWNIGVKKMEAFNAKVPFILTEGGISAEQTAKGSCPVDTGHLRQSYGFKVNGNTLTFGTDVEYAPYVEYGTIHMAAQPHFRVGIMAGIQRIKEIANKIVRES